ncbi:unnamed protein product [Cuscuta europaea]|uniref:Retrotransposon Copia-like N-terminal domain-containing protein n=1 Tax=Cuscuta europaea TaxID=41803 RepID=A0A9P0YNR7_CUSEU|nr:unnamed protein product [Cuscuta europaea]
MALPDHLVNPANPLFLHPGENPSLILVTPLLEENNFPQWKHDILIALQTKNKDQFVLNTLPCPSATDPLYEAWRRCNKMVVSWLSRSMSSSIRQSVMWIESASEIWRDLSDRFSHGDKFRIADLQEEIQNCRQGDQNVSQYFTRLRTLWKELSLYRTVLKCTCSPACSCGILAKIQKERDDDYIIKLLRGLREDFNQVRSQVMLMDTLPTMTRTFSLIQQQEREFGGQSHSIPQETIALATITPNTGYNHQSRGGYITNRGGRSGKQNNTMRNNKFCTKCKKTNHTVDTCFHIYGFPPGYNKNTNADAKSSANVAGSIAPFASISLVKEQDDHQNAYTFTKDQYNALMALVQQSQSSSSTVNTVTNHHVPNPETYLQEDWSS